MASRVLVADWSLASALVFLLGGCAGSSPSPAAPSAAAESAGGEVGLAELLAENVALHDRIDDLEGRLSRVEAQNTALREALTESARAAATDTADFVVLESDEADDVESSERPVLRLHGSPAEAPRPALAAATALPGPVAPMVVAPPPLGSLGRLLVTGEPSDVPAIPLSPIAVAVPAAPAIDEGSLAYQAALRRLSERDVDGALVELAAFLSAYPEHAYADNALYFRGEIFYARHAYREAIEELEHLVARYPTGSRLADALLRIGTCWERLGDSARAARYFERVRTEHPDSAAARMADREDT